MISNDTYTTSNTTTTTAKVRLGAPLPSVYRRVDTSVLKVKGKCSVV